MEKEFYVYVYLDPRKPGKYIYSDYEFDYEPFYVGKGKENRCYNHLQECHLNDGSHKSNLIKKLITIGEYPNIKILENNLNESEALLIEINLIKSIGRYDLNNGPLTNKTDGGEGICGYKWSEEQRDRIKGRKPSNTGKPMSEEQKVKIGDANRGKTWKNDISRVEIFAKLKSNEYKGSGNPFYGKTHNEESLKKMRKLVFVYNIYGDLIGEYESVTKCAESLGIPMNKISKVANGELDHYKEMVFKYGK